MADEKKSGTIFDRRAGRVIRACAIVGYEYQVTPSVLSELDLLPVRIAELLMRHDSVCFSLYGENLIAPILLSFFGARGLLDLLAQGAIKFHLQSESVVYFQGALQPGVRPLAGMVLNSSVHCQPDASVADGLSRCIKKPDQATFRRLQRELSDAYLVPDRRYAATAARLATDAYERGRFSALGLAPSCELASLPVVAREQLATLATEMQELAVMAELQVETLDEFTIGTLFDESVEHLSRAGAIERAAASIFRIENIPSFEALFARRVLPIDKVAQMRMSPDAVRFRTWLRDVASDADAKEVGQAYVNAVLQPAGFFTTQSGRLLKTLAVTAVSGAIMASPAGVVGGLACAGGLGVLDEFVLGHILKGWTPRNYFDKSIRPAIQSHEAREGVAPPKVRPLGLRVPRSRADRNKAKRDRKLK